MQIRTRLFAVIATLLLAVGAGAARRSQRSHRCAAIRRRFLPLMLMERDGLIEKHAKAAGLEVKTNWQKVAGPSGSMTGCCPATCISARSARPR